MIVRKLSIVALHALHYAPNHPKWLIWVVDDLEQLILNYPIENSSTEKCHILARILHMSSRIAYIMTTLKWENISWYVDHLRLFHCNNVCASTCEWFDMQFKIISWIQVKVHGGRVAAYQLYVMTHGTVCAGSDRDVWQDGILTWFVASCKLKHALKHVTRHVNVSTHTRITRRSEQFSSSA